MLSRVAVRLLERRRAQSAVLSSGVRLVQSLAASQAQWWVGLAGPKEHEFRAYVAPQNVHRYPEDVRVGAVLVSYRHVPAPYGVRKYRRNVVNDVPVLVDPRTRRIVQVIR